jgi:tRNA/rRNA methyltransferase
MMQKNSYKVFHSSCGYLRKRINIVMVRPELGMNVGSAARAIANTEINGEFIIVGSPSILDEGAFRTAKHAGDRLRQIRFFDRLDEVRPVLGERSLWLASTARVGSPNRPHPLRVREAAERAITDLKAEAVQSITLVFGAEGSGLTNEEIDFCDWVVTIPSSSEYRSLNLAQAVLIFCHELNMGLVDSPWGSQNVETNLAKPAQKQRLIQHLLQLAEEVGFVLPGDPFKMRPRLQEIFNHLPNHIKDIKTLHGFIAQTVRTVRAGRVELRGRFKHFELPTRTSS